jgi:hypothetical protein
MNEWMNEWLNEWMNGWMNEWIPIFSECQKCVYQDSNLESHASERRDLSIQPRTLLVSNNLLINSYCSFQFFILKILIFQKSYLCSFNHSIPIWCFQEIPQYSHFWIKVYEAHDKFKNWILDRLKTVDDCQLIADQVHIYAELFDILNMCNIPESFKFEISSHINI